MAFLRQGASVVVGDVDVAAGRALEEEVGGGLVFQHCDMAREAEVEAQVATAVGRLDAMFNNAGIEQPVTPSHELA